MQPQTELILEWLSKADDDLRMAELALGDQPPVCWAAAFHAAQAAEKLLKGLLTFHQIEFERSHNIDYLLDLCVTAEPQADDLRPTATKLTDFAVEPRYPLPQRDPTEPESQEALAIARQVRAFVRKVLPPDLVARADRRRP